jgi:hypothetical protein
MGEPPMHDQKYLLSHVLEVGWGNAQPPEAPPDEVEVLVIELIERHGPTMRGSSPGFSSK